MKVGISTYAYRWELEKLPPAPETIIHLLEKTREAGGEVFQICDYEPIETFSEVELRKIRSKAEELNIELELGTQGVEFEHLKFYIDLAAFLEVRTIRSMVHSRRTKPDIKTAADWLRKLLPLLEKNKVTLALETYEPVQTKNLVELVEEISHPAVGICLDPANSLAELEVPDQVIERVLPYVTNVHLKDFIYQRKDRTIGFDLIGTPVGEGQLDLKFMLNQVKTLKRPLNGIIELWLPAQETMEQTLKVQDDWIVRSV